jgi:hypothetical protein
MGHCLWNSDGESHTFHLANWKLVSMKKEYGGLGVPDLRDLNTCLLGSWIERYARDNDKLWKQLVGFKFRTQNPNIFTCHDNGVSNFLKGVLWAMKVAKMGYRWRVGNGKNIRFCEDVYCIINEHNKTISEIWDGVQLKCTFMRCVDLRLFNLWEEVVNITNDINFTDEEDALIWQFQSSEVYSSQSLYGVINFRGVF